MIPFDFQLRTRIVFGPNSIDSLGELTRDELPRQIGHSETLFGYELIGPTSGNLPDQLRGDQLSADLASVTQGDSRRGGSPENGEDLSATRVGGSSGKVGEPKRVLIVSDPGVCAAGHVQRGSTRWNEPVCGPSYSPKPVRIRPRVRWSWGRRVGSKVSSRCARRTGRGKCPRLCQGDQLHLHERRTHEGLLGQ
jgi:hypothetical protein